MSFVSRTSAPSMASLEMSKAGWRANQASVEPAVKYDLVVPPYNKLRVPTRASWSMKEVFVCGSKGEVCSSRLSDIDRRMLFAICDLALGHCHERLGGVRVAVDACFDFSFNILRLWVCHVEGLLILAQTC